jgi:hypothetical protein
MAGVGRTNPSHTRADQHFSFVKELLELVVLSLQWRRHRIVCREVWLRVGASF